MIGRSTSKASLLAASVLTLVLITLGSISHPAKAATATEIAVNQISRVVSFISGGTTTEHVTTAKTVGEFLKERGLNVGAYDYIYPAIETAVTDHLAITYRPALPVTVVTSNGKQSLLTTAENARALLADQGIALSKDDEINVLPAQPLVANETIRITHVLKWARITKQHIAEKTVKRIDFSLPPGSTRIISAGNAGLRETVVSFIRRDGGPVQRTIATRIVRKPKARIIAQGVGEYAAFARMARYGLQRTSYIAASELTMVATAYTAGCAGCSGITALGYRAGHGVVAVDPRIIPLGTRLYIPGYGAAIAGDTGGAIVGNRIDLGFNSESDALLFGRRTVTVYRLR